MGLKIKINMKLVILSIFLVGISCLIMGMVGYNASKNAVNVPLENILKGQALSIKDNVEYSYDSIQQKKLSAYEQAERTAESQAQAIYALINSNKDDAVVFDAIKNIKLGKTGYTYVMDYNGMMIYHPVNPALINTDMMPRVDANGVLFIQDQVKMGKTLSGNNVGFSNYWWSNPGENASRQKIGAVINIPDRQWIVVVTAYFDDMVPTNFETQEIEKIKDNLAKQVIGTSGYVFVVDSEGKYIVSKDRLRDGEDISQSQDTNGVYFIQEMIQKAKAANGGADLQKYPWLNPGDSSPRMKIASVVYIPELDWIVAPSTYYDDLQAELLTQVRNTLLTVGILALLVGIMLSFFVANSISSPIRKMTSAGNKIADGNLNEEIPNIKSGDEIEDLGTTMTLLVGAIKFLKGESLKKAEESQAKVKSVPAKKKK